MKSSNIHFMKKTFLLIFLMPMAAFVSAQDKNKDNIYHLDKEYTISPKGKLSLKCTDAKVSITGTNRKNAHVKIHRSMMSKGLWVNNRDEFSVDVEELDGNLKIEERRRSSSTVIIGYVNEQHTIDIELPESASLEIKGDDGDYWVRNVDGAIDISVDDADVDLMACSGNDFRFDIKDGNLNIDESNGRLELQASDGRVRIKNSKLTQADVRISDGNLDIETTLANNGQYVINAGDGSVNFTVLKGGGTFDIRHGDRRVTAEGDFKRIEESDDRSKFELPNGTARINVRSDDARIRLMQGR